MPAVLATAILIAAASFIFGRALLFALGRSRPTWLSGAVGFGLLVIAAPILIRLPGQATTAAIVLLLLLLISLVWMRSRFFADRGAGRAVPPPDPSAAGTRGREAGAMPRPAPRAAHACALA